MSKKINADIRKRFSHLKDITHIYVSKEDNTFDITVFLKEPTFEKELEVSKIVTELMRSYDNVFFDFIIHNETERSSLEIEELPDEDEELRSAMLPYE